MLSVLSSVSSFENPAFDMSTLFVLFFVNRANVLMGLSVPMCSQEFWHSPTFYSGHFEYFLNCMHESSWHGVHK